MKCLEKDRTRRYETANGLAMDLRRHLNNEVVSARPPSARYLLQKAFRRNRLVFAAASAVLIALVGGLIGTSAGFLRAERQRRQAEAARRLAEQRFQGATRFVEDVFQKVAPAFEVLIGATEAQKALAQTSVSFLESLSGPKGSDEAFQAELAKLYGDLARALGNPMAPNTVGDYTNALRVAIQSMNIQENLHNKHPGDAQFAKELASTKGRVGSILLVLGRTDEALAQHRQSLDLFRQLLDRNPGNAELEDGVTLQNFKIGHVLRSKGLPREALEQHYLPYGKQRLQRAIDTTVTSKEAHDIFVAHMNVAAAEMELKEPSNALPHLEAALGWKKLLVQREPNNARHARDWSEIHSYIGAARIALGQFDAGLTNLQEGVDSAEALLARDPMNGSAQAWLVECLHEQATGLAELAQRNRTSPEKRAELWSRVVQILSRCRDRLASPAVAPIIISESGTAREIAVELDAAREALAKLAANSQSKSAEP